MKNIGNIVIVGLLAAIGYMMLNGSLKKDGATKQAAAGEKNKLDRAGAMPVPAPIPQVTMAQLVVVRGIVTVAPNGAGLLVSGDLTHPAVLRLPPGPGPRDDDRLARVMMDEMNKKWGPLLMFDHGAWRTVNWILPPPEGSVLLKGHPNAAFIADGEKMNIVAAPLLELYQGTHVCTAQFNLVGQ